MPLRLIMMLMVSNGLNALTQGIPHVLIAWLGQGEESNLHCVRSGVC